MPGILHFLCGPVLPTQVVTSLDQERHIFQGRWHALRGGLTCVAQGPLAFGAGLVIPLARGRVTLDVDLHAILVVPLVVGLVVGPVLSLLCESLVGSHPGPLIIDLSDPNPVVRAEVWDDIIEVSDFILVLDGH